VVDREKNIRKRDPWSYDFFTKCSLSLVIEKDGFSQSDEDALSCLSSIMHVPCQCQIK
jgi:hypothetical protein